MSNKLNLPPFYIGETVEYITGYSMPKGTKVVVTEIFKLSCNCKWGIAFDGNKINQRLSIGCMECGCIYDKSIIEPYDPWLASSFRSIQTQKFPLLTFKQIQEVEKEEVLILN